MSIKIMPASEVRNHLAEVLAQIHKEASPCFVTKNGRAVAALLPMEVYDQLMSDLEDRLDEKDQTLAEEISEARGQFKTGHSKTFKRQKSK
jgi:prevent-host-death family protein